MLRNIEDIPDNRLKELHNRLTHKVDKDIAPFVEFVKRVKPTSYKKFCSFVKDFLPGHRHCDTYSKLSLFLSGGLLVCPDCKSVAARSGRLCRICAMKERRVALTEAFTYSKVETDLGFLNLLDTFRNADASTKENVWVLYKEKLPSNYARMRRYFSGMPTRPAETSNTRGILRRYLAGDRYLCPVCKFPNFSVKAHHACRSKDHIAKVVATHTEKYGGTGYGSSSVSETIRNTMVRKHGVSYTAQSAALRSKMKETLMANHGVSCAFATKNAVAGRGSYDRTKARARYEETMNSRYGENWAVDLALVMSKARYKYTTVTLGSVKLRLQGYEPQVAKFLFRRFPEIRFSKNPKYIPYVSPLDNRERKYVPDLVCKIGSAIRVIEVKSTYTAGLSGDRFLSFWQVLKAKARGTLTSTGIPLDLIVFVPGKGPFLFSNVSEKWGRKEVREFLKGRNAIK